MPCRKCGKPTRTVSVPAAAAATAAAEAELCADCGVQSRAISIPNPIRMEKQLDSTSCWVSAAHFVMACDGMKVPSVRELTAMYQEPKKTGKSASLMEGAGKPQDIIEQYKCKTTKKDLNGACDESALDNIFRSLSWGVPVVAMLRAPRPHDWAAHAVCIVSLDTDRRLIGYKDSGRADNATVEQSYGAGGNKDFFELFHYRDFLFGNQPHERMALNFYCQNLLFTTTPRLREIATMVNGRLPGLAKLVMEY